MKKKRNRALFTRHMKKTHTILLPQMLEYHSDFLKAAFEGSGYRFEIMRESGGLKDRALRYISNEYCYPAVLIVGQVLKTLESGRFPADRIAFMEPQAGGACRAGNYYQTILRTLQKCGQEQIPVISLNFMGEERHPGFRITPRLLLSAVTAVCFGDLLLCLYQQTKPYECEAGAAERALDSLKRELMERIRTGRCIYGKKRREAYRHILETFQSIPVDSRSRQKVLVAGEVYIKFSSLGNHNLEQFLQRHDCQCSMGGFINYAIYVIDSAETAYMVNARTPVLRPLYHMVLAYMKKVQRELYAEIGRYGRFTADSTFDELKAKAEEIIGYHCITGDGWLVAAEAADAIEKGCRNVLILHPFGCLVSHVCERGILKNLRQRYPGVAIQTVEYDYDSSDTLRESRILLGLKHV